MHHQSEDGGDNDNDDGNHDVQQHASMATLPGAKGNLRRQVRTGPTRMQARIIQAETKDNRVDGSTQPNFSSRIIAR